MEERQYYLLPWYKKIWFTIYDKVKNYFKNFRFPWLKFSIFAIIVLLLFAIIAIVLKGAPEFPIREEYDKAGFIKYSDLTGTEKVYENENYKFVIDYSTTYFTLTDKRTLKEWKSTPETMTKADTLVVYYSDVLGAPSSIGNYNYSIDYEDQKRYLIRVDDENNSIEVLYQIGGKIKIDYTDLPQVISQERFDSFMTKASEYLATFESGTTEYSKINKNIKIVKVNYSLNQAQGYYSLTNGSSITENYIGIIHTVFHDYCGYTDEDLLLDNLDNGVSVSKKYPQFEISMKYTLENDGLKVEVVNDSIVDYENEPMVYVDVLPYFGSATTSDTGYTMIPDGSGILVDFNNNRSYASNYEQRIYGADLAKNTSTMLPNINKISLGLYGMKVNNNGFINVIEKGSEICSIVAKNSTLGNPYNQAFYRYYIRETDKYVFSSLSGASDITSWTNEFNSESLIMKITCCENDGSYSEMAKLYQNYLIKKEILSNVDKTNGVVLDLTLIGGYLKDTNFLGIPYSKVESLTNATQVEQIVDELLADGITNINLIYDGWSNDGIKSTYIGKLKYNNVIASKRQLIKLNKYLSEKNINFYPLVDLSTAYTKKNLSSNDLIKDLFGNDCVRYQTQEATYLQDNTTRPLYTLSSSTYLDTLKSVTKKFEKLGFDNIGISDLGSDMYGSYKSTNMSFRTSTISKYIEAMNKYNSSYKNIMTSLPNDYALKYTNIAINIPTLGTNYQIVQTSIPFYQLVMSGYIDYSSESFNINDEYSFDYYKMKAIETGSNIALTWTYSKTTDLIETEYDYLYSTYYKNWYDDTVSLYNEMNLLNIYSNSLSGHMLLDTNGKIAKSIYSNGKEIIFNYSNETFNYEGKIINANSYKVVKEGVANE